jgi:hypothetical protein
MKRDEKAQEMRFPSSLTHSSLQIAPSFPHATELMIPHE